LHFNKAYDIIGSELFRGGLNVYVCSKPLQMSELRLIPLAELKGLSSELRLKPSVWRERWCIAKRLSRRLTPPFIFASLVLGYVKFLKEHIYKLLGRLI
jgi:hypothetical protein